MQQREAAGGRQTDSYDQQKLTVMFCCSCALGKWTQLEYGRWICEIHRIVIYLTGYEKKKYVLDSEGEKFILRVKFLYVKL